MKRSKCDRTRSSIEHSACDRVMIHARSRARAHTKRRHCQARTDRMSEGKNLVGVDIGSSSIKVAQLKEGRKGYGLVRAGYAPLPPQSIVDGHVMNSQAVVEGLTRVFSEAKIKQKDVALSISGQ